MTLGRLARARARKRSFNCTKTEEKDAEEGRWHGGRWHRDVVPAVVPTVPGWAPGGQRREPRAAGTAKVPPRPSPNVNATWLSGRICPPSGSERSRCRVSEQSKWNSKNLFQNKNRQTFLHHAGLFTFPPKDGNSSFLILRTGFDSKLAPLVHKDYAERLSLDSGQSGVLPESEMFQSCPQHMSEVLDIIRKNPQFARHTPKDR